MNLTSRNLLLISTVALLTVTPALFLLGILRTGLPAAMGFYGLILVSLALVLRSGSARSRKLGLEVLIYLPVVYLCVAPLVVLAEAIAAGGYEYFLSEMVNTYAYLTSVALLLLVFSSAFYATEKGLDTGKMRSNLFSILSIALCVRLYWLIMIETEHLAEFSALLPHLRVEYVVLGGIPLFAAVLVLTLRKNLFGYVVGAAAGLPHVALVTYQFLTRYSRMAELRSATPQVATVPINAIAVFFASLVIFIFCLRGIKNHSPKLPENEHGKRGLRSVYIQAIVAMMLIQLAQIAADIPKLIVLSKATGSPIGLLALVTGCIIVVALVMAVMEIKWGLILGIIAGAWMIFHPLMERSLSATLDQSVAWWYLLVTMIPALSLFYFCVLARKKVFQDDESRMNTL